MPITESDLMGLGFFPDEFSKRLLLELNDNKDIIDVYTARMYIQHRKLISKDWWTSFFEYYFPIKIGYSPLFYINHTIKEKYYWYRKENIAVGVEFSCFDETSYHGRMHKLHFDYAIGIIQDKGVEFFKDLECPKQLNKLAAEHLMLLQALSDTKLLPLCVGLKVAEPYLEYFFKA